jgi:hypothetical protein
MQEQEGVDANGIESINLINWLLNDI